MFKEIFRNSDVERLLESMNSDHPSDIRNYALLLRVSMAFKNPDFSDSLGQG
jgi:hypothetical protein